MKILIIDQSQVQQLLPLEECIEIEGEIDD